MVNEDIRAIVEAELEPGEKLLWAEKVDSTQKQQWIIGKTRSNKRSILPLCLFSVLFIWFGMDILLNTHRDAEVFLASIGPIFIILFGCLGLYATYIGLNLYRKPEIYSQSRPYSGYALTNSRLIYLRDDREDLDFFEASGLKHAKTIDRLSGFRWKPSALCLSPVQNGWLKMAELYFLPNFKTTEQQINDIIATRITP